MVSPVFFHLIESFKNPRLILNGYAGPLISYLKGCHDRAEITSNRYSASRWTILDRVFEQVSEDLLELLQIGSNHDTFLWQKVLQADISLWHCETEV